MNISVGTAAKVLGVLISALRRWESENALLPSHRTLGGHRKYEMAILIAKFSLAKSEVTVERRAIAYARVSSSDQKLDLESQNERLAAYCHSEFSSSEIISDLGSGLNYKKSGLKKLLQSISKRRFTHPILTHKDRLLRFGSEIIFSLCEANDIEVILLDDDQ
ncbi:MAG: IS607 family transposase [Proteobacteria bacterium]|nr:MAG: IS607 family transposase [Pseudomonadota bacterium]